MLKKILLVSFVLYSNIALSQDTGIKFFENNIRNVLTTQCYSCHSSTSKDVKGGLSLDTRQGILNGGDSGPSVVPGKIDESLLLDYIESGDMPPDNPLSGELEKPNQRFLQPDDHKVQSAFRLTYQLTLQVIIQIDWLICISVNF